MNTRLFVSGTGTGIGKTLVSAILVEALKADYWKPVQAGYEQGTDSEQVYRLISNRKSVIHPERYKLKLAASPHIAAREENTDIDLNEIFTHLPPSEHLIVEGAGGLLVPLGKNMFVIDLIKKLNAEVVLVSRNELGSINHSLMSAAVCKYHDITVRGWIFNGNYLNYEEEIVNWTGIPRIMSIPDSAVVDAAFVLQQAARFNSTVSHE